MKRSLLLSSVLVAAASLAAPVASIAAPSPPASVAAMPAGERAESTEVFTVAPRGTGATVRLYDPAPGVTPAELRARLRATGATVVEAGERVSDAIARVQPKTGPGSTERSSALAACLSYGTARQWCDRAWAANGFEDPQVYFLDHTSSSWPVSTSVSSWNQAQGIDSFYRWYTQGCPAGGVHCVHVYSGAYGSTGWTGEASWGTDSTGDYDNTANVTVKLNDSYPGTASERRNTTCHELGHALGLNHNTSTTSCLYSSRTSVLTPNADDYSLLPRIYGT